MPELEAGMYLIDLLFRVGPTRGEMPLVEADLEPWERRRGIELSPWQADTVLELSQAYLRQAHAARDVSALSPWPTARGMWAEVCAVKSKREKEIREKIDERHKELNGTRKRHRNSSKG